MHNQLENKYVLYVFIAVQRWILTAHDRAKILQTCREMAGMCDAAIKHHKDASAPRMKKDEHYVHKAMHTIESWVNPFKSRNATEPLVNIASAVKATDSITDDLRTAEKKGNAAFVSFVEKRLKSNEIDYLYAPLPKSNLQTFGNLVKSRTAKSTATAVVVKADRGLFARMVVIAHHRQMNMQEVLTYPLGPLPWSLATADGAPTTTAKSALLHILEGKAQPVEDVPASAVWILDGVAIILHSMKDVPRTFSRLASYVFQLVKSAASQDRTRTDLIMDQYPDVSIKNPERERRGAGGSIQIAINHGYQKCPTQWNGHDCIAIKSPDTDVAVLACTFSHSINAKMLFCIDTKQRRRYLDMTAIGQSLGEDVCKALPGVHALTGCDSTSAFVAKGKRQAFHYGRVRPKHVRCHDDGW